MDPACLVSPGSDKANRLALTFVPYKSNKRGPYKFKGKNVHPVVTCPYCKKPAVWVSNAEVYGGKQYGESYMIWLCAPCKAYVGCHKNTKVPKGTLANKALRTARVEAHNALDPLWKSGAYSRKEVYRMLGDAFNREVHIGEANEGTCRDIIAWVSRTTFSNYYKQNDLSS